MTHTEQLHATTTDEVAWSERYAGGSPEAERTEFEALARGILEVQSKVRRRVSSHGVPHPIARAFHAKATLAVDDAELRFRDDLAADLQVGFAQPGATYRTVARFSNASGSADPVTLCRTSATSASAAPSTSIESSR